MVEYNYDGYGNIISMIDNTTNKIGEKNPYRYRSYYYDTETSWYYLNSRYYDSSIGRFITMDEIEYLGGTSTILSYNLFTYCEGNPINRVDNDGQFPVILSIALYNIESIIFGNTVLNLNYNKDIKRKGEDVMDDNQYPKKPAKKKELTKTPVAEGVHHQLL